ncbi:serine/threonine-protein kinase [Chitinivorax sp. B]|uniref:serine/threonine-protein kinase n=1 Tax=Chitinivorax sp. B TaxID=2502235 RepID=UPI0010F9FAC6|nr:serine/threonine-protein kinase [Chitinivorax sp. B]
MLDQTMLAWQPVQSDSDKVGRYQMREKIGEGAMARVFKAYDPEIDRTIAIKVLRPELSRVEDYRTRFLRESRGAGVLSHPNIVTVYDVGEDGEQPYIAMEFVDGHTLSDLLKKKEVLSTKTVVEIGIQLAKALDYAHKRGVIHRDVKPANIMQLNDSKTIKVADFGICRIEGGDATQATRVGDVLGTPNYMSPEQVSGQAVDARSDLFSAGVVLYQLLAGALPFEGDTLVSVALKIMKSDPVPLDKLRPDLPLSLRRIIDRTLRKQPDKRFQTGDELAQALIGVAKEIAEAGQRKEHGRLIPIRVRWALIMATIVSVTMVLASAFIHQRQDEAMMQQAMSYGGSLAKFMASRTSSYILAEEWTEVDVFIQDTISRQAFSHLQVIDHQGIVRGSNLPSQIGTRYVTQDGDVLTSHESGVKVQRYQLPNQREVLDFEAPVVFQSRTIGTVHLGIFLSPLTEVSRLTLLMLGALILVTTLAVAAGSYFLAQRLSEPLRVLRNSLKELALGRYDYRIGETRRDDFGELYEAFDAAAQSLQQRHDLDHPELKGDGAPPRNLETVIVTGDQSLQPQPHRNATSTV